MPLRFWLPLGAATLSLALSGCHAPDSPAPHSASPSAQEVAAHSDAPNTNGTDTNTTTNGTDTGAAKPHGTAQATAVSFDQQFLDSMVPHHESAVMMAQMVVTRAQFPEVRALAKSIIGEQQQEIAQMKAWRKTWFGSDVVPPMPGHGSMELMNMEHGMAGMDHSKMNYASEGAMKDGSMSAGSKSDDVMTMPGTAMGLPITGRMDMSLLTKAKGSEVDHEFLRMMIPHHANAIVMAQEVLIQSKRPLLQKLARSIIAAQAREIGAMEAIAHQRFGAL